ncbi:2-epi-5-epi-valiolone synthase [Pyricularia oryzae 70-15]|uniref:2-epi-5-epi-valiolone synthase n=2 Tax=Pyricularia oryzae TaxID=318829 RepID=G4NF28_PYRO7|nr:2-epi-5-epi-valiolone synthase [Pyricularia oryzae 70-15]EHA49547.1 2-epi-5-epi-valiolone synthase [Pyricularia oryzae 70-15]ELQ32736.1 2-epi-5-epi-valiolone synthase [Pyricularia oryzae Y34]KAI7909265.1 2-epi-5-epi-valiolone synthase [Pyricularia oryzae]KAI7910376.1 2-epi-5-epi-valiolone synthase [Pyricularia oryzae]
MSDLKATVSETPQGFHVEGYEKIEYDFTFVDGVFDVNNPGLANCYKKWGRVLAVTDKNIFGIYGKRMQEYFQHYDLDLTVKQTSIGEKAKTIDTYLSICDAMTDFGIIRKEPVLVVGGGLVTDVAGFACASYRRNTNFIRVPTTVIGLIDASVSIKVAVNHGRYKNRLGAYHAPIHTFLDFTFLRTLPKSQVRNGFAELIKISSCAHLQVFDLLDKYCEQLIDSKFGRADGAPAEVRSAADIINREGIYEMLKLESPNLHEIGLDRVIAYGHTWSPLHELMPETPLRHGHAISIDMAYTATLANTQGLLKDAEHKRLLDLFSRAGLSIDHPMFDEQVLEKGTAAILKTRDGKLRLAVPNPLGSCTFLNDLSAETLNDALRKHKAVCKTYPRGGEGLEAYVDASDTGYTDNAAEDLSVEAAAKEAAVVNAAHTANGGFKGANGHSNKNVKNGILPNIGAIKTGIDLNGHGLNGLENSPLVDGVKSGL